jgi:hypothetical protein
MSVAKQVYARALHVTVPKGVVKKLKGTNLAALLGDTPANHDTVTTRSSRMEGTSSPVIENASALSIPSHPVRVVGNLLGLTARQRELLRSMTESVTANEYGKVEGSDAVIVSSSVNVAAVVLHALGFSRERESGKIASSRFVKAIESENGRMSVATARIERTGDSAMAYTLLSVE